jgi:hypothetical protein
MREAGGEPVQLPTKFKMAVNTKTAKALGLTVPLSILRAPTRLSNEAPQKVWTAGGRNGSKTVYI